jgi:septal ring-binding cell division protein DamX
MSQTAARAEGSQRAMASMRLAELRMAAGLARGDRFSVAASIEGDRNVSMEAIRTEVATLQRVAQAASKQARSTKLVPRSAASTQGVQRTMPSLVTQPAPITSVAGAVGAYDDDAESLFD